MSHCLATKGNEKTATQRHKWEPWHGKKAKLRVSLLDRQSDGRSVLGKQNAHLFQGKEGANQNERFQGSVGGKGAAPETNKDHDGRVGKRPTNEVRQVGKKSSRATSSGEIW